MFYTSMFLIFTGAAALGYDKPSFVVNCALFAIYNAIHSAADRIINAIKEKGDQP